MHRVLLSVALFVLLAVPAGADSPAVAARWSPGVHFERLEASTPVRSTPGKIEVAEFFGYKCPHCNALEPHLAQWKKHKPDYVEFVVVPVTWKADWRAYAQLYYTLQALGREDLHAKVLDIVHRQETRLATKDPEESFRIQLAFAKAQGIDEQRFTEVYRSPATEAKLTLSTEAAKRFRIALTPSIVIAGKYVTDVGRAGGREQLIELINDLTAAERAATSTPSR
jgi:thiol:disulfide interchange protein DsbA